MKIKRTGSKKRLIIVASISLTVLLAGLGVNAWFWSAKSAEIAAKDRATQQFQEEADKQIAQIKADKIAKEEARKIAAAELAERSTRGDASTEGVDSSVCNPSTTRNNPASIDVVVNKKHCLQPIDYQPSDLVTSNGATLSAKAINAFNQLYAAAVAAGQGFSVTSSYRSYQDQVATYAYWVSVSGKNGADTYSARPGYSEHQTGLAFDVSANGCVLDCFGSTTQYVWLQAHAAEYGFIQRYYSGSEAITGYKAEEWHYRYVGVSVAKDMQSKGLKTLEEYWKVAGGDY